MKITTQTIADLAGVSRATVDKVIHGRPGVGEAKKAEILRIMSEQNYVPVPVRRKLRESASSAPIRIAIIMSDLRDDFMTKFHKGTEIAASEHVLTALQVDYYYCSTYDPQPTLQILEYLSTSGVNGIALRGFDDPAIIKKVNELSAAGIAVLTFDTDVPGADRICYIGEDLERTGSMSASLLCRSIGYQGEIAVMIGSHSSETSIRRLHGFEEYLSHSAPDVRIVTIEETFSQPLIAYEKTRQVIDRYPDLAGIWNSVSQSEDIARAIIDAGKQHKIHFGVLSFSPEIIELIRNGSIDHTIGQTSYKMGKLVVETMYDYLAGGIQPPKSIVHTPIYIGIDANIDLFSDTMLP